MLLLPQSFTTSPFCEAPFEHIVEAGRGEEAVAGTIARKFNVVDRIVRSSVVLQNIPICTVDHLKSPAVCEKTLRKILCFFRSGALSPNESIEWSPVSTAEFLKCLIRGRRFACAAKTTLQCVVTNATAPSRFVDAKA